MDVRAQDPWWNPAVEEQAVMRIHRIGQTKSVAIKRFIVKVPTFIFLDPETPYYFASSMLDCIHRSHKPRLICLLLTSF